MLAVGLVLLAIGVRQVAIERALRSPQHASALVTQSIVVTFPEKGRSTIDVDFTSADGKARHAHTARVLEPLPKKGDRIDIEYAQSRWAGLVVQQAGYGAWPADGTTMRDLGATLTIGGALSLAWTLFRRNPPDWFSAESEVHLDAGAPGGQGDWSHRLHRPEPPR